MGGAVAITLASLRPDLAGEVTFLGTQKVTAAHGVCRSVRSLVNGTRLGEYDLPNEDAERRPVAGVRVLVVPEAAHSMMEDNPNGFAATLADALGGAE